MKRSRTWWLLPLTSVLGSALLGGCGQPEVSGPPNVRLGRDVCTECDMIVSEDRYSAGAVVRKDGVLEHVSFDDIGCMLDYQRFHPDVQFVEEFVREASTHGWVAASNAYFVVSETIRTPMGSGIEAYADGAAADAAAEKARTQMLRWEQVREQRRVTMERLFGKPRTDG